MEIDFVLPSILDREIQNADEDLFGHIHYAEVLYHLIDRNKAPFTIGLLGKWGTGKSSIKKLCKNNFLNNKNKYKIIDFNAWRYESSDVRLSLLKYIYLELKKDNNNKDNEANLNDELLTGREETKPKTLTFTEIFQNWATGFGGLILQSASFILLTLVTIIILSILPTIALLVGKFSSKGYTILECLTTAISIFANALFLKPSLAKFDFSFPLFSQKTSKMLPAFNFAIEQERIIRNVIENFIHNNKNKKIVIFIDDLDRLSANDMIACIDAIRVFLDMKMSDSNIKSNVIFVLSCDENNISNALNTTKKDLSIDKEQAKYYLDRIFQFRVEIPDIPQENLLKLAEKAILNFGEDGIILDVDFLKKLPQSLEILVHADVTNPRTAKQLLNSFLQSYWIACKREKECTKCKKEDKNCTNNYCLLGEKTVTNHLDTLAIITVLKVEFPKFYTRFSKEPDLLRYILLKTFGIQNQYINDNNADILKDIAETFFVPLKEGFHSRTIYDLKDKQLHFYLSSIRKIKLPPDLKSFVLLFEDSISREIGVDRARPIMRCLQAGEYNELIKLLDYSIDKKDKELQTQLILNTYKSIDSRGNSLHKKNADTTIGSILNHLKGGAGEKIIEKLAQSLNVSLNSNINDTLLEINFPNIKDLLLFEPKNKETLTLYKKILLDLLDNEGKLIYTIDAKGEDFNQNWLTSMIEVGLELIYKHNLIKDFKPKLLDLINKRSYPTKGIKSEEDININKISYDRYEEWIANYQELKNDLNLDYIKDTFIEFNKQNADTPKGLSYHIDNIKLMIGNCYEKNADKTIDLLSSYANHPRIEIVDFIFEYLTTDRINKTISIPQRTSTLNNLTLKLLNLEKSVDFEREETQKLLDYIAESLNTYKNDLLSNANPNLGANIELLIKRFSLENVSCKEKIEFISRIFDSFYNIFETCGKKVLEFWVSNMFLDEDEGIESTTDLRLIKLFAEKYITVKSSSDETYIKLLIDNLEKNIEDGKIEELDDATVGTYEEFISNLPEDVLKAGTLKPHFNAVFGGLDAAYTNDYEYFNQIFLIVAPIMKYCAGDALDDLFIELEKSLIVDEIDNYTIKINEWMIGNWFKANKELLLNYSPQRIYDNNLKLIKTNIENENKIILYKSSRFILDNLISSDAKNIRAFLTMSFHIALIDHTLSSDYILRFIGTAMGESFYMDFLIPTNVDFRNNAWKKFIKYCKVYKKEKLLIEKSMRFFNVNNLIRTNCYDWFNLIKQEYSNNNILYNTIFENIKKDRALLNAPKRRATMKSLQNFFGKTYEQEAVNFAKFLFQKEVYMYNLFYGTSRNSMIDWITELSNDKVGRIINKKSVEKLPKEEQKRIALKFKDKKGLKDFLPKKKNKS